MRADPELAELLDRGPNQFLTKGQRVQQYVSWFLLGAVVLLTVGYFTVHASTSRANTSIHAQCLFYHDIAQSPVPVSVSPLGLAILADARIAYAGLDCRNGVLAPADPRVAAILPPGVH